MFLIGWYFLMGSLCMIVDEVTSTDIADKGTVGAVPVSLKRLL
jgi:hypothetical protein